MPDPTDPTPEVTSAIENLAIGGVQSATGDGVSATNLSPDQMIKAANWLAGKKAGLGRGFKLSRIRPGGTVNRDDCR